MRMELLLVHVLGIFLMGVVHVKANSGYFFVTAPNVIRFNHNARLLVNVFNAANVQVDIWLQIPGHNNRFSQTSVTVQSEDAPVNTTIIVTEEDLFPTNKTSDKPKFVTLYASSSLHGQYSKDILLSYDTGYIIMQTSKPIYHPTDEVRVRVLALTESLRAATGWNISMDLIGPQNKSYGRTTKTDASHKFFVDAFKLPPNAETGLWTIRAFFGGQYVTEGRTTFRVKEYVLPTFGVTVDVEPKVILPDTEKVSITVTAEYVYKKHVKGQTVLKVGLLDNDVKTQFLPEQISRSLIEGKATIEVEIRDIIDMNGLFPIGQHLFVKARVIERATGKEEMGGNKNSLFSEHMYKINFEKSKNTYRPGFAYSLRVVVQFANGETKEDLDVRAEHNGEQIEARKKTDRDGYVLFTHNVPSYKKGELEFKVFVGDSYNESFTVKHTRGQNHLQVDQKIKHNSMIIDATTTIRGDQYSGIITLITSRGEYIENIYLPPGTSQERTLEDDVIAQISSEAWVIGFYVEKSTGILTADSSRFAVKPRCRGSGLTITSEKTEIPPDGSQKVTITGSPSMGIGLNVMDEALLLLEHSNILEKSKMFDTLKSHSIGCGQGGGQTAEEVFRDAGLVVVTNARIDEADLKRTTLGCTHHSRRKRALDCASSTKYQCCKLGEEYAQELINESREDSKTKTLPDPYTKCLAKTLEIEMMKQNGRNKYSFACLQHHLLKCIEVFIDGLQENRVGKSIFDDGEEYISALQDINVDVRDINFRDDFKDSWFFNEYDIDGTGQKDLNMLFPSSITSWMIQAIGISDTAGPCIADSLSVKTFKPFFIQIDVPYTAFRLEYIEIKATVFYYGNPNNDAKVTLFLEGNKFLCTGVKPLETKKITDFTIETNDAFSVRIPLLPLQAGQFPIKVIAVGRSASSSTYDAIEKTIIVENEGIEEKEQITVCLDPRHADRNCTNSDRVISSEIIDDYQRVTLNLTLPAEAIKGTGSASGFLSSNVMDDAVRSIIKGMDHFMRLPSGCAQQTASSLSPLVYVMNYWKQTNQMTATREQNGNRWIRDGIIHQLTYKKDDSFGAFISSSSSTRLTAFVAKVLCQANKVVDNAVDRESDIIPITRWLQRHVNSKAAFYDDNPYTNLNVERSTYDHSLTAFVIITLLECEVRRDDMDKTVLRAKRYLLDLKRDTYRNDPYLLAISTYALSLAGKPFSNKVWKLFNLLKEIGQRDISKKDHGKSDQHHGKIMEISWNFVEEEHRYWTTKHWLGYSSRSVETTSYALLACIKFGDWSTAADIVRWLVYNRGPTGFFASTDIPAKLSKTTVQVVTKGIGSGRLVIDYRYNRLQKDSESCSFKIDRVQIKSNNDVNHLIQYNSTRRCDVCGRCEDDNDSNDDLIRQDEELQIVRAVDQENNDQAAEDGNDQDREEREYCVSFKLRSLKKRRHGMSIVDVGLETGVTVNKDDLDELKENKVIDEYEMPATGKGFFILYLNEITSEPIELIFRLHDSFQGDEQTRQPSSIKVYDYYLPEYRCVEFYGTGTRDGSPVPHHCDTKDGNREESCSCLKKACPEENPRKSLMDIFKARKRAIEDKEMNAEKKPTPAQKLQAHTCDSTKADFAVLVNVTSIRPDYDRKIFNAQTIIHKVIHPGRQEYQTNDEIELYWKMNCDWISEDVELNKPYYLITKDGEYSDSAGGNDLYNRYELIDTTVFVQQSTKRDLFKRIMNKYEELMSDGCAES